MKLLLADIETAPIIAGVWGLFDQDVAINQIMQSGYTLCWSAKWFGSSRIYYDDIRSGKKKMLTGIHKLLDEADAVCHYNGDKYDIPTLNGEFLVAGMTPPSPAKQMDLLKVVRHRFRFPSNKMDYVAMRCGTRRKLPNKGFELWLDCMAKKPAAWKEMKRYNNMDVLALEDIYLKVRPWIKDHLNLSTLYGRPVCPNCGKDDSQARGQVVTRTSVFQRFVCNSCGTWHRATKNLRKTEKRVTA